MPQPESKRVDRSRLHQLLTNIFNLDGIEEMCFNLGIRYENLPGETLTAKARELIDFCERQGRLHDLIKYCKHERPDIEWDQEIQVASQWIHDNTPGPSYEKFVERENVFSQVVEALKGRSRLIVIVGMGGVGKTSLAIEVVRHCSESNDPLLKYEEVVWIDGNNTTTLRDVLNAIAERFEYLGQDKRDRVDQFLRGNRVLVIIDNYETVEDEAVHEWLKHLPGHSKVLIISHGRPGPRPEQSELATRIELREMNEGEAAEFIRQRQKMVDMQPPLSSEVVLELIEITGGNPKALAMAIGGLKHHYFTMQRLREEVRKGLFRGLFDYAWSNLDEQERKLFMSIALFPGSASVEALQAVSGMKLNKFDEAIVKLLGLSLVDLQTNVARSYARYSLHPLVRTFCNSMLEEHPAWAAKARQKWLEWIIKFLKNVEWPWKDLSKLKWLTPEEETAYVAIKWAAKHQQHQRVIELARGVDHYYYVRGDWDKKAEVDLLRIDAARKLGDLEEEALSLAQYVQMLCTRGHEADLKVVNDHYLPQLKAIPEDQLSVDTIVSLKHAEAFYHIAQKDFEGAYAILEPLQEIANRAESNYSIANRHWAALCLLRLGKLDEADEQFQEALTEAQQNGYERSIAFCQRNLAEIALARGDMEGSAKLLKSALDNSNNIKDRRYIGETQLIYAEYYLKQNERDQASEALAEAEDQFTRLGLHTYDQQLKDLKKKLL